ncbi:uncharacterized protein LACBIDRAFT_321086 [Laccaria bicolor S238N-H82]|uniref:Predicted protein n=1 Tax=Laccaria bicolor (strain S238N-H82 / ATCC MYA-4686) TaxID=486041 RepID=B0CNQ4_LACBS|nr:uncharacterized protein LACBIDRAFT_321086 [Laccaria bicolor S238N-H82]EDR15975.1 predicted protein [Laccaria bicolor S238N-H82]|eukprot:XP_001874183.1 predicted protein [Laccaria bicolor S238N-H82]
MDVDWLPEDLHFHNESTIELPLELLEIIFHLAAAECRRFCYTLCSVSTWGRIIALRHLLVSLMIKGPGSNFQAVQIVAGNILHQPSQLTPSDLIQNIWMPYVSDSLVFLFDSCKNLKNLATDWRSFDHLVEAACGGHPWRVLSDAALWQEQDLSLSISTTEHISSASLSQFRIFEGRFADASKFPIFSRITHLRLTSLITYCHRLRFPLLTCLTHLALPYHGDITSRINCLLERNSKIKMLVIVTFTDVLSETQQARVESGIKQRRMMDNRIYAYPTTSLDTEKEWLEGTTGGRSIWEGAVRYTEQNLRL